MSDKVAGDVAAAYRDHVEPFRAELPVFCYRMLASVHDAEDAVQETMVRAWRGLPAFEGRSTLRRWLYRIAADVCHDLAGRRRETPIAWSDSDPIPAGSEASGEVTPTWLEPLPPAALDAVGGQDPARRHELLASVELAFLVALQYLPARQRGALILRDVLGFSAEEAAGILETSVAAVNSGLQRARERLADAASGPSQQEALQALDDQELGALVRRYTSAWERRDIEEILRPLTDDARFSMPPEPSWYVGTVAIRGSLTEHALRDRWRFLPARANGQLAFGTYAWDEDAGCYQASGLDVITLRGARIGAVTAFLPPDRFPAFDLPDRIGPAAGVRP
jgi:RNA polymerase sigma-70 factor (ECF subfamily)